MQIDRELIMKAKEALGDDNAFLIAEELEIPDFDEKNLRCRCPFHQEDHASFIYNPKAYNYHCFGSCGRDYDILDVLMYRGKTYLEACQILFDKAGISYSFGELGVKTRREYRYPSEVHTGDRAKVDAYFKKRKISPKTLDYADVRQDEDGNIVWNYYDTNDVLTMVKYRPSRKVRKGENKCWCQKDSDTTPILFNMNRINTTAPLLICEGEPDCLTAIEVGFTNVVSVPLGAGNFHWIEENWEWLEQFNSIIICADNDPAGDKMRTECVYRLGSWRTKVVELPFFYEPPDRPKVPIKDLNEVLFWFGPERALQVIQSAKDSPVPGVVDFADIEDIDLDKIDGIPTGLPGLDRYLMKLFYGTFNIVTGVNGCVSADTEYFNGERWKPISEYTAGEKVLQYSPDGTAQLVLPEKYHKYPCSYLWEVKSHYGVDQLVSNEHNLVYLTNSGSLTKDHAIDIIQHYITAPSGFSGRFITTFDYSGSGISLTDEQIYTVWSLVHDPIAFDEAWYRCSNHQLEVIADGILSRNGANQGTQPVFTSDIKECTDFVQFVFSATGKRATVTYNGESYAVTVSDSIHPTICNAWANPSIKAVQTSDGYKYCFTVPSGMLVLRHNGRINITGNSGKSSFLNQIIAQCLDAGENAFLYSGELPNFQSKSWLNFIFAGQRNVTQHTYKEAVYYKVTPEAKRAISDYYRGRLFIRKDGESNKKSDVIRSMEDAVRKYGTKLVIIDNMTSLNLECSDENRLEKQAELVNELIAFATTYHVVVILVVHPHKIDTVRRLNKMDVQGVSAIIDLAHRIISLYRVQERDKKGGREEPIKADVIIDILKDRLTGHENGTMEVFYDKPSKRFFTTEAELDHAYNWDRTPRNTPLPFPPPQLEDGDDEVFGTVNE